MPSQEEARTAAAVRLQRFQRRKKEGDLWRQLLKDLPKLRADYIDEAALVAGAADNPLYSDLMLASREKLRADERVVAALDAAWRSLLIPGRTTIARKTYMTMSRKLYLAAIVQDAEENREVDTELIDPQEALSSMDADWLSDSGGKETLEREDFHKCVFQLCDVQTKGVSAEEYAEWIRRTFARVRLRTSEKQRKAAAVLDTLFGGGGGGKRQRRTSTSSMNGKMAAAASKASAAAPRPPPPTPRSRQR